MKRFDKIVKFLDFMVVSVFISTFAFTFLMAVLAWKMNWESVVIVLTERWFNIMIGELVVMGTITMVKEIMQSQIRMKELKFEKELNDNE